MKWAYRITYEVWRGDTEKEKMLFQTTHAINPQSIWHIHTGGPSGARGPGRSGVNAWSWGVFVFYSDMNGVSMVPFVCLCLRFCMNVSFNHWGSVSDDYMSTLYRLSDLRRPPESAISFIYSIAYILKIWCYGIFKIYPLHNTYACCEHVFSCQREELFSETSSMFRLLRWKCHPFSGWGRLEYLMCTAVWDWMKLMKKYSLVLLWGERIIVKERKENERPLTAPRVGASVKINCYCLYQPLQ